MSMPDPIGTPSLDYIGDPRFEVAHRLGLLPGFADGLATHALGLADLGKVAAGIIEERGWTQKTLRNATGEVCLHGALQEAVETAGGGADYPLVSALFARRGSTMGWNDSSTRSREEVLEALRAEPLSDGELDKALGPQWITMVGLLREVPRVSVNAASHLAQAAPSSFDLMMRGLGMQFNLHAAEDARYYRNRPDRPSLPRMNQVALAADILSGMLFTSPLHDEARPTIRAAAAGLSLRDLLVGKTAAEVSTSASDHERRGRIYDVLTGPWRTVVGPLHPDDRPLPLSMVSRVAPVDEVYHLLDVDLRRQAQPERHRRGGLAAELSGGMQTYQANGKVYVVPPGHVSVTFSIDPATGQAKLDAAAPSMSATDLAQYTDLGAMVPDPSAMPNPSFEEFKARFLMVDETQGMPSATEAALREAARRRMREELAALRDMPLHPTRAITTITSI